MSKLSVLPKSVLRKGGLLCLTIVLLALSAVRSYPGSEILFTPLNPGAQHETFSFVVYGDIQDNYQKGHQGLVRRMLTEKPHLVFNTGDISKDGGRGYEDDFYPVVKDLVQTFPFFPAVGNHDIRWNSPESRTSFRSFFSQNFQYLASLPGNDHLRGTNQKLWYSFVYGRVLFVVLDSNFFIDEGQYRRTHALPVYAGYRDEQLRWFQALLRNAAGDTTLKARFVFFHHSPFTSAVTQRRIPLLPIGGHPGHREMLIDQKLPSEDGEKQTYLLDTIREAGVTAVFTGHEHFYERWSEEIRDKRGLVHRLNWIVSGLGGVKPRGTPAFKPEQVREIVETGHIARYRTRIRATHPEWTSDLRHAYPNPDQTDAHFHNYVLVTVAQNEVRFQTKDTAGRVRDEGLLSLPVGDGRRQDQQRITLHPRPANSQPLR